MSRDIQLHANKSEITAITYTNITELVITQLNAFIDGTNADLNK
jgi:hypothetical protein